jgi:pyruvate/2-oxoglutarate dehydrogenase complex dihydrolipoamide acyltransferase (E2) component
VTPQAGPNARAMADPRHAFRRAPYPRSQDQIVDWLEMAAAHSHPMHALVEVDVTNARRSIREYRARTREPLSFTGFLVACMGTAIAEHPGMHAFRNGRRELVLFDDVDVAMAVESTVEGAPIPVPHIVRAANRKHAAAITREILAATTGSVPYAAGRRLLPAWLILPPFVRRFIWSRLLANPHRRRRLTGTTFVTAVGMFGRGSAWGIPQAHSYPVGLTMGGVSRRPRFMRDGDGNERIEGREVVNLTVTFDHNLIDGAPAARFVSRLSELIERGPAAG